MIKAKRPLFSKVESGDNIQHSSKSCRTCWQSVEEPCIGGIFFHADDFYAESYQCQLLIPVLDKEIDNDMEYMCPHEFRKSDVMLGALKCSLCGFPTRIDLIHINDSRSKYYCFGCKKEFAVVKQHFEKKHKRKVFEYKEIHVKEKTRRKPYRSFQP